MITIGMLSYQITKNLTYDELDGRGCIGLPNTSAIWRDMKAGSWLMFSVINASREENPGLYETNQGIVLKQQGFLTSLRDPLSLNQEYTVLNINPNT